jgi:hypothetical protein
MVDESSTKAIDSEITRMCAFRLATLCCSCICSHCSVYLPWSGRSAGDSGIAFEMFLRPLPPVMMFDRLILHSCLSLFFNLSCSSLSLTPFSGKSARRCRIAYTLWRKCLGDVLPRRTLSSSSTHSFVTGMRQAPHICSYTS